MKALRPFSMILESSWDQECPQKGRLVYSRPLLPYLWEDQKRWKEPTPTQAHTVAVRARHLADSGNGSIVTHPRGWEHNTASGMRVQFPHPA